jgi:hypothetical protein
VQCIELEKQLKEIVNELKSAQLIIELLQQESSVKITSNQDDVNRSDVSQIVINQGINTEWVEVSCRYSGVINRIKKNH